MGDKRNESKRNLAFKLAKQRKFTESESILRQIIAEGDGEAEIYNKLGYIYISTGKHLKAIRNFNKALSIDPLHFESCFYLATCLKKINKLSEAISIYKKASTINPNFSGTFYNLGNLYYETGDSNEAIVFYQRAIKLAPDSYAAYNNLGNIYKDKKEINTALDCYKKAIRINPNFQEAYINLGYVLKMIAHIDGAINCYKRAIELGSDNIKKLDGLYVELASLLDLYNDSSGINNLENYINRRCKFPITKNQPCRDIELTERSELVKVQYLKSCKKAIEQIENMFSFRIKVQDKRDDSIYTLDSDFEEDPQVRPIVDKNPELLEQIRLGLHFLICPNYWTQQLDQMFTIIASEINSLKRKDHLKKLSVYEIGTGTGYLLHRLRFIKGIILKGCDVYERNNSQGLHFSETKDLKYLSYSLITELLNLNSLIENFAIYSTSMPKKLLSFNIIYCSLPVFDDVNLLGKYIWSEKEWILFIKSVFEPKSSQIDSMILMLNYHSFNLRNSIEKIRLICDAGVINAGPNGTLICRRKRV